jgi:thiol:disulfide interchange protein
MLLYVALAFGAQLIATAPASIVNVFDLTNCYAVPPVAQPCERIAYRAGALNAVLNVWCGLLLLAVAVWLLWELWSAVAPTPITDDFLKLLDDSFARDWRKPRTWPWTRVVWAYGFTLVGVTSAVCIGLLTSAVIASSKPAKTPSVHVETSQRFRLIQ